MTEHEPNRVPEATPREMAAVDAVVGPELNGAAPAAAARRMRVQLQRPYRRDLLLPALLALQQAEGWISPGGLAYLAQRLALPLAEAYGVASFYGLLALEPEPPTVLHVCDDVACQTAGAMELCQTLERVLGPAGSAPESSEVGWHRSPCLGRCAEGPAVYVQRLGAAGGGARWDAAQTAEEWLQAVATGMAVTSAVPIRRRPGLPQPLTGRIGRIPPDSLDAYRRHGGYQALRRALALGREGVLREIAAARLVGRGGAGFPTAAKWEAVAKSPEPVRYLVVNADESEPGTFKDRALLEGDPFAIVEGATIAAWVIGAHRVYVFVRGEYPEARRSLEAAIAQARAHGYLGATIMDEPYPLEIEVRSGAGAYICGEETALFNAIEGKRGEPRNKPPFPTVHGLFGKPTVVNNVETIANVPVVLNLGAAAYRDLGSAGGSGTRLFCVSGQVMAPGLVEVPIGTPLKEVVAIAGGLRPGRELRAVLLGGAAGTFVGPEAWDMALDPEVVRARGATLGSGVVVVFDDTADLGAIVRRIARFFREESCGQCVPCRLGTVRQLELVERLEAGRPLGSLEQERALHRDLVQVMRDASICGLGQTAANAVASALALGLVGEGSRGQ
ncbi:MAG: NAD(P)H-dependent oxidoreductase subunit E [Firmicutes bacterium]|nr:NAD(P)H-dependent oxidoreductase subunit E [Alicyclobacillaceae bacterium]MCL6497881.1 NAD(P)H-dependent oxidoreductase subunit E [Bacillota bacterium]